MLHWKVRGDLLISCCRTLYIGHSVTVVECVRRAWCIAGDRRWVPIHPLTEVKRLHTLLLLPRTCTMLLDKLFVCLNKSFFNKSLSMYYYTLVFGSFFFLYQ